MIFTYSFPMKLMSKHSLFDFFTFPSIGRHNSWLDLLRAWAIILVVVRHGQRDVVKNGLDSGESWLSNIALNGWVGVDLFLVLSGFLIGKGLLNRVRGGNIEVLPYLRDRVLRIVPAYYAVLFLIVIGIFPGFTVSPENLNVRILYHLLFLQDYLPSDINVVFWSLGVEEKFYLLAPLLFFALVRFRRARGALLLLAMLFVLPGLARTLHFLMESQSLSYSEFYLTYRKLFHYALEPLIIGVALSMAHHHGLLKLSIKQAKQLLFGTTILAVILLSSHSFMQDISSIDIMIQPQIIALLCGLTVMAAVSLRQVTLWLEPVWRVIARLSYVLYLVHFPLLPISFHLSQGRGLIAFWVIYIGISCLVAVMLHFGIEKPFLNLKKNALSKPDQIGRPAHVN